MCSKFRSNLKTDHLEDHTKLVLLISEYLGTKELYPIPQRRIEQRSFSSTNQGHYTDSNRPRDQNLSKLSEYDPLELVSGGGLRAGKYQIASSGKNQNEKSDSGNQSVSFQVHSD